MNSVLTYNTIRMALRRAARNGYRQWLTEERLEEVAYAIVNEDTALNADDRDVIRIAKECVEEWRRNETQ